MHLKAIINVVGALLGVIGAVQIVPMLVSLAYGEPDWEWFGLSAVLTVGVGAVLMLWARNVREISERDGFFVVTLAWLLASIGGAVPYMLTGAIPGFTNAVFESMSGFTTTGASVLSDFSGLSHGVLLWRSMTQWFGGMGIIVLALVVLPALGIGGMQLYKREVPGPYSEKLTPKLRDTARALWVVYVVITLVEAVILYLLGMTPFEAINHALTTVSTGGFSTRGDSVGGFNSAPIEWVIIFFMFLSGINYSLHFRFLARPGKLWPYFRDMEWIWYASAVVLASLVVVGYLVAVHDYNPLTAATKGTFQVVSIITTTGFGSDDYVLWGAFPQILLLFLMLTGGCAGSTSGGVKWVRILLVFRYIHMEMQRLVHPRLVVHAKINQTRVTPAILSNILAFIFLFTTSLAVVTMLIALDGHSILTSIGAAASALGNIGPGLDTVGPMGNYMHFSDYAKWVLILAMMMGRLELMTVMVLFLPQIWRR